MNIANVRSKLKKIRDEHVAKSSWVSAINACDALFSNALAPWSRPTSSELPDDKDLAKLSHKAFLLKGLALFSLANEKVGSDLPYALNLAVQSLDCYENAFALDPAFLNALLNKIKIIHFVLGCFVNPSDPSAFKQNHLASRILPLNGSEIISKWFLYMADTYKRILNIMENPDAPSTATEKTYMVAFYCAVCLDHAGYPAQCYKILQQLRLNLMNKSFNVAIDIAKYLAELLLDYINVQNHPSNEKRGHSPMQNSATTKLQLPDPPHPIHVLIMQTETPTYLACLNLYKSVVKFLSTHTPLTQSERIAYKSKHLNLLIYSNDTSSETKRDNNTTPPKKDKKVHLEKICPMVEEILMENTEHWLWEWFLSYNLILGGDKETLGFYSRNHNDGPLGGTQFGRGLSLYLVNFANYSPEILQLKKNFIYRFPYLKLSALFLLEITLPEWIGDEDRVKSAIRIIRSSNSSWCSSSVIGHIKVGMVFRTLNLASELLACYLLALIYRHGNDFQRATEFAKSGLRSIREAVFPLFGSKFVVYEVYFNLVLAQVCELTRNQKEAFGLSRRLLSMIPNHYESMVTVAEFYYRSYDFVKSRAVYVDLMNSFPMQLWSKARLAWIQALPFIYSEINWPHENPPHAVKSNPGYAIQYFPKIEPDRKLRGRLDELETAISDKLTCAIRAKSQLESLVKKCPEQPWYAYWLGCIHWSMREPNAALTHWNASASMNLPHAMAGLGKVYLFQFCEHQFYEDWDRAHANLLRAYRAYRSFSASPHFLLELNDTGVPYEAVLFISHLLIGVIFQLHPAQMKKSTALFSVKDDANSIVNHMNVFAEEEQSWILFRIAMVHMHLKRYSMAVNSLNRYLKTVPDDTRALFCLADLYMKQSHFSAAKNVTARIKSLDPDNPIAHYFASSISYDLAQFDEAEENILRALKLAEVNDVASDGDAAKLTSKDVFEYFYAKILFARYNRCLYEKNVQRAWNFLRRALDFIRNSVEPGKTTAHLKLYGDIFSQVYVMRNVVGDGVEYYLKQGTRAYSKALLISPKKSYLHASLAVNLVYCARWLHGQLARVVTDEGGDGVSSLVSIRNSVVSSMDNAMGSLRRALVLSYEGSHVNSNSERLRLWRFLAHTSAIYLEFARGYAVAGHKLPSQLRYTPNHSEVSSYFYRALVSEVDSGSGGGKASDVSDSATNSQVHQMNEINEISKNWISASLFWWSQGVDHKYVVLVLKKGYNLNPSNSLAWALMSILEDPNCAPSRSFPFHVRALIQSIERELENRPLTEFYESLIIISSVWLLGIVNKLNLSNADQTVVSNEVLDRRSLGTVLALLDQAAAYNPKSALVNHLLALIKAQFGICEPGKYKAVLDLKIDQFCENSRMNPFYRVNMATDLDANRSMRVQLVWQLFRTLKSDPDSDRWEDLELLLGDFEGPIGDIPVVQYIRIAAAVRGRASIGPETESMISNFFCITSTPYFADSKISKYLQHIYLIPPDMARSVLEVHFQMLVQGIVRGHSIFCDTSNAICNMIVSLLNQNELDNRDVNSRNSLVLLDLLYWYTVRWFYRVVSSESSVDASWVLSQWTPILKSFMGEEDDTKCAPSPPNPLFEYGINKYPKFYLSMLLLISSLNLNLFRKNLSLAYKFLMEQKSHNFASQISSYEETLLELTVEMMERLDHQGLMPSSVVRDVFSDEKGQSSRIRQQILLWGIQPHLLMMRCHERRKEVRVDSVEKETIQVGGDHVDGDDDEYPRERSMVDYLPLPVVEMWKKAQVQVYIYPWKIGTWWDLLSCTISLLHVMAGEGVLDRRWVEFEDSKIEEQVPPGKLAEFKNKLLKDFGPVVGCLKSAARQYFYTSDLLSEYRLMEFVSGGDGHEEDPIVDLTRGGRDASSVMRVDEKDAANAVLWILQRIRVRLIRNWEAWTVVDTLNALESVVVDVYCRIFGEERRNCHEDIVFREGPSTLVVSSSSVAGLVDGPYLPRVKAAFLQLLVLFLHAFKAKGDAVSPLKIFNQLVHKNGVFKDVWSKMEDNSIYVGAKSSVILNALFVVGRSFGLSEMCGQLLHKENDMFVRDFWILVRFLMDRKEIGLKSITSPHLQRIAHYVIRRGDTTQHTA